MTRKYSESAEGMDVSYVAHLARLQLSDEEISEFEGQLAQVLDYVKQLEELDVEGVEPMAHAVPIQNVFRKDEPRESMPRSEALDNAPESREQQFKVPQIIE